MADPTLGLIMILKNEAQNLPRSLLPVAHCFDEITVIDTGSTDATPAICAQAGAKVHGFEWRDDFSAARNRSIESATADWLLWLDGDNAVAPEMISELRALIAQGETAIIWGQERIVPSGERLWQKRCFPRLPGVRFQGRVHEQLMHPRQWPQRASHLIIDHWGYCNYELTQDKGRYYAMLLEQSLADDPDDYYSHFQMARCRLNLREFSAAEYHLWHVVHSSRAAQQNIEIWTSAHQTLADLLVAAGKGSEALSLLDGHLAKFPESALIHYRKARLLYDAGQWALAANAFVTAINLGFNFHFVDADPLKTNAMAHYFLARCLAKMGRSSDAVRPLEQAVELVPQNQAYRLELAKLLVELGFREQAAGHLMAIIAQRPNDRGANMLLKKCEDAA